MSSSFEFARDFEERADRQLPDYLPARMVNEFVYCPRLFYYEWVEGIFVSNADVEEGSFEHRRVDRGDGQLETAAELDEEVEGKRRSVMLSSDRHRLIGKIDVVELDGGEVKPVDYKHGAPRKTESGLEAWPTDRVQLAIQAVILRENGYRCEEGYVFYQKTRQRVRVVFTDEVIQEALEAARGAWEVARQGSLPPPLEN